MRKLLILVHRYLGIVLSLLFFTWFISGIAMIYTRGMPSLTPESRLEHLPVLSSGNVRLTPALALTKAELGGAPDSAMLLNVVSRPAYRFESGGGFVTVFADNGELLDVTPEVAFDAARQFIALPEDRVQAAGLLNNVDQWTILARRHLPLHKFVVADALGTELYVSGVTGETVVLTTRNGRMLAWISAIPHWLYFEGLRKNSRLWRQVILWTSTAATIAALIGLILAVIQYRRRPPHIPYKGWLRWHYITGAVFGILTVTWVFSGFLSVEPWYWASDGAMGGAQAAALQGGELDLRKFPIGLPQIPAAAKEVEFLMIQGNPYYRVRTGDSFRTLVSSPSMDVRHEPFSTDSIMERVLSPTPDLKVLESTVLEDYDSYYYAFDRSAPLPVLRIKFNDPESTWLYVDPQMGELVARAHRRERINRWIYHGFHSLDFSFWYYSRPLWDIVIVGLSLGGALLSFIGIVIAWKRMWRAVVRTAR
jgi:hypothetical protein